METRICKNILPADESTQAIEGIGIFMEQNMISIVVPVYRAEKYIEETMDCVARPDLYGLGAAAH